MHQTTLRVLCWIGSLFIIHVALAQDHPPGKTYRISSSNAMFPDSLRNAQPRVYDGKTYTAAGHYSDSSVLIYVPKYFNPRKPFNVVFWFHGWLNNIDSSIRRFALLQQFYDARRNAIFIFPEGPKDAPDSYGGKLEQEGRMLALLFEATLHLMKDKLKLTVQPPLSGKERQATTITLAGHSGAYRVMGKNVTIANEILLFDGLYGEMDNYLDFCLDKQQQGHRFIHIFTNDGGTKQNSIDMMHTLDSLHVAYLYKEEADVTDAELQANRIIFLHSQRGHNDVITDHRNFERFLRRKPVFVKTPR